MSRQSTPDLPSLILSLGRLTPDVLDLRALGDQCLLLMGWTPPKPTKGTARGFRWGWETPDGNVWTADPNERPNPLTSLNDAADWMARPLGYKVTLQFDQGVARARIAKGYKVHRGQSHAPEIALTIACVKAIYGERLVAAA